MNHVSNSSFTLLNEKVMVALPDRRYSAEMNESISRALKDAGITLSKMNAPKYEYVTSSRVGDIVYFSGKTAQVNGYIPVKGKLGMELSIDQGREAARVCATNLLSQIEQDLGLENVVQIVKVLGFVASSQDFYNQPDVINAASELFVQVLGDSGKHARSAIGVSSLPGDSPVEIEIIVKVKSNA